MKLFYKTLAAATIISSSLAHADTYPEFQQYNTPDIIKCEALKDWYICTDNSRPDKQVIKYQNKATGEISMQEERTFDLIECNSSKCVDGGKNYRGKTNLFALGKNNSNRSLKFMAFKDYYIYPGADGADYGYKNGTGPLFGGAMAKTTVVAPATASLKATPSSEGTYDVWCDPVGDACNITIDGGSDAIARDRLPEYMPMAKDTSNCNLEFCSNSDEDVIGLNPDYDLWKK